MRQEHDALLELFAVLGRPWTMRVLWELRDGPLTYRAVLERTGGMSSSVLTARIRTLRQEGLVERTDSGYALTSAARAMLPVMVQLDRAAAQWLARRHHTRDDGGGDPPGQERPR